jgi:hypothetical protein
MTDLIQPNSTQTGLVPNPAESSPVPNRDSGNIFPAATVIGGLLATVAWVGLLGWGLHWLL